MNRTALACTTLASLALLGSAYLTAGPLSPPAGPVASTHKTLTEIEPRIAINAANTPGDADSLFKIEKQGSYYLTGNVTGVVGKHGIEIAASGVTIDLNGYDLVGVPGMGAFDGVLINDFLLNIEVRNGSVRNWGDGGVVVSFIARNVVVRDVRSSGNAGIGIEIGQSGSITGCTAYDNTVGIATGTGCTISGCAAFDNSSTGIATGSGCTISGSTAYSNTGSGIVTSNDCTISSCTSSFNTVHGIVAGNGCTISQCTSSSNTGDGMSGGAGSTITGCTAFNNGDDGIITGTGSHITQCTARLNGGDGIQVASLCTVSANSCTNSGNAGDGAGIHATGADNRIEGNNCTGADRGIDVDAAGNIIIKNTCSGNTIANWDIAANNVVGPILDRTAPGSAAILGNSAPDSTGSTHPNANFTY